MSRFQGSSGISNALVTWAVTIGGLLLSLYVGKQIAGENFKFLAMIFAIGFAMVVALSLGKYYWILIPVLGSLTGSISLLPIPFSYAELGTIAAVGLFVVHIALKKTTLGFETNILDLLLILNLAWLTVAYIRNPIGFRFTGGDTMGGREYVNVAMAVGGYLVLCHNRVSAKLASKMPYIIVIPGVFAGCILIVTQYVPALGRFVYPFYSGVSITDFAFSTISGNEASRITGFGTIAKPIGLLLCAVYPPITLFLPNHPIRCATFLGCWVMVFLSGFRNMVVSFVAYIGISTFLRKRWSDFWVFGMIAIVMLGFLVGLQGSGFGLPYTFQRALSFIPLVDWDSAAVRAGADSAQWRFDMWDAAWNTDKYIKDKVLGDGFGFSAADFGSIMDVELGGGTGFIGGSVQEAWMIRGSFHSGPLSAIRFVGIIGLIFFTMAMLYMAYYSVKIVNETQGTPFFTWALFLAIPLVYLPFEYYIIFGGYNYALPIMAITTGYMKMLKLSFNQWKNEEKAAAKPKQGQESLILS
jgi:hypothetical protein